MKTSGFDALRKRPRRHVQVRVVGYGFQAVLFRGGFFCGIFAQFVYFLTLSHFIF